MGALRVHKCMHIDDSGNYIYHCPVFNNKLKRSRTRNFVLTACVGRLILRKDFITKYH
jgi:hypothetical protein